jgi:hypothetical protein
MIEYYKLGSDKQLNEIVMAGSHDAGITGGGANAKTQSMGIHGQAEAGVRVFDLRIAAAAAGSNVVFGKQVEMRAIHADPKVQKVESKNRFVESVGTKTAVDRTKLGVLGGTFGLGLQGMLRDAKKFVTDHKTEFLILKFDKSGNWKLIADLCVAELGSAIFTVTPGTGNLNTKKLKDLQGKVIVLFTKDGFKAVQPTHGPSQGILQVVNLSGGSSSYNAAFDGLQYCGKGGTNPFNFLADKIQQNMKKQKKLMRAGATMDPNVMGMMYWTTTGLLESIKDRNDVMWKATNVNAMRKLWSEGLAESIESRLPRNINMKSASSGAVMKAFMPNIVMIDFADPEKCRIIYDLNSVAASALTAAAQAVA